MRDSEITLTLNSLLSFNRERVKLDRNSPLILCRATNDPGCI